MTDFDKRLIEKADNISCWDYRLIDDILFLADTDEARRRLVQIRWELYDLVRETL